MNKLMAGAFSAALLAGSATAPALGDSGQAGGEGFRSWLPSARDVEPIVNERYRTECGGCHFAYQPGLLPAAAWGRIMESLDDHFGDDATLDPVVARELLNYLSANAANDSRAIRSRAFAAVSVPSDRPPRITETLYFHRHHDVIPTRMVKDNPKVGGFSNCQTCHRGAEQGVFNGSSVDIPGVGHWDG